MRRERTWKLPTADEGDLQVTDNQYDHMWHMARAEDFARNAYACRNEHCTVTFEEYWKALKDQISVNLFPKPVMH